MEPSLHNLLLPTAPLPARLLLLAAGAGLAIASWRRDARTERALAADRLHAPWTVAGARWLALGGALLVLAVACAALQPALWPAAPRVCAVVVSAAQLLALTGLALGAARIGQAPLSTWLLSWLAIAACAFALLLGVLPALIWALMDNPALRVPPPAEWSLLLAAACSATLLATARQRAAARVVEELRARAAGPSGEPQSSLAVPAANDVPSEQERTRALALQSQLDTQRRRVDDLQRVQQIAQQLGRQRELSAVLDAIARAAGEQLGAGRVVLRLYNPRTHLFEARAFAGLPEDEMQELSNRDVTMDDFLAAAGYADRPARSWVIAAHTGEAAAAPEHNGGGEPLVSPLSWRGGTQLIVPIRADEGTVLGYLGVEDPSQAPPQRAASGAPGLTPAAPAQIELLEALACHAALAIESAQLHGQLERSNAEISMANEKLRDLNRLKSNFVATVSHELRTPLTSIKAYSDTLEAALEDMETKTVREFVRVIATESERLNGVIDDILDVNRLETGRAPMVKQSFSLKALCADVVKRVDGDFKAKGLRLCFEPPAVEAELTADRSAIEQLLTNLLDNAQKFTPEGGEVRLQVDEEVSLTRLVVEDSGIGIPEEEMERIFDRFYQVDGSSTRPYGGQGLGLAICRDIVEWHDGRIWVERAGGRGTRFVALLPRKELVIHSKREDAQDVGERMQREEFLQLATALTAELMGTRIASIMLVDPVTNTLRIEAAVGLEEEVVHGARLRKGEGIAGRVWSQGHAILVDDLRGDVRFAGRSNTLQYSTRSLLSAPLCRREDVIGVVNVNNKLNGQVFDEDDRLLLEALSERLVKAFDSLEAYRVGHRRLSAARQALRAILDVSRDRRSAVREQVARCGLDAARRLGLQEDDLRALSYVFKTYDLGLARVGEQILRKISPLSAEDRERINDHARQGAELTAEVEPLTKVRQILYHHHENVDGSGYPDGLEGEAIPVGARLVRLTDVFAALLHDRPFRRALSLAEAVALVREGVGRRFCPRVSAAFLAAIDAHRDEFYAVLRTAVANGAPVAPVAPPEPAVLLPPFAVDDSGERGRTRRVRPAVTFAPEIPSGVPPE